MENRQSLEQLNEGLTVFSLIVIGALGVMAFQVLPPMVMGMLTELSFSEAQVGRVSSAQLGGIALGSFLTLYLVTVFSWRGLCYFGLGAMLLCDVASMFLDSYTAFLVIRLLAGTAGGICVSFGAYALGNTAMADRNFGLFLSFQVVSAILANMFLPGIVRDNGIAVIFIVLVVMELIALLLLVRRVPNLELSQESGGGSNTPRLWKFCFAQLGSILFFFVAVGGFWTYIAPIGLAGGLAEQETGRAISLGLFGGLAGAFLAAQLNIRCGRFLPISVAFLLMAGALALLFSGFDFMLFVLAAGMYMFGWYMYFPYQLGTLAALDRDGRPMILANAVAGVGSGVGPFIVSLFLSGNYTPAYVITATVLGLSVTMTLAIIVLGREDMKSV